MCESLIKHRHLLTQAIRHPEYERVAAASTSNAYFNTDGLSPEDVIEIAEMEAQLEGIADRASIPAAVRKSTKYAAAYASVSSSSFWKQAHEFVELNSPVQQAITDLSSDSATLSDAARMFLQLNKKIILISHEHFPALLTVATVNTMKAQWDSTFRGHLRPHHFVALLLDPRKHMRQFVQDEPAVIGASESRGDSDIIRQSVEFVRQFADTPVPDGCPGRSGGPPPAPR